jgi:hypothetical protein
MKTVDIESLPMLLTITQAVAVSGLAKTEINAAKREGRLEQKHRGRRCYIVAASLIALVAGLPT